MPADQDQQDLQEPLRGHSSPPPVDYFKPLPLPLFVIVVGYPFALVVTFFTVLAHDVYRNGDDLKTEPIWTDCWQHEPDWNFGVPHWGGLVVQWLSTKMEMEFSLADDTRPTPMNLAASLGLVVLAEEETPQPRWCSHVPHPMAVWTYLLILPWPWMVICSSSVRTRWLVGSGALGEASRTFHRQLEDSENREHKHLAKLLYEDAMRTRYRHFWYLLLFQVAVFFMDAFVLRKTWRWILTLQAVWLGYGPGMVVVRPTVMYAIMLSLAMVDKYILDMRESRTRQLKKSWLELAEDYRDLELTISRLWLRVNLMTFTPCMPFLTWAGIHLMTDPVLLNGALAAFLLFLVAVATLLATLYPLASISTMFNSRSAFRSLPSTKRGKMAIVPAAKKLVIETPGRSYGEERHYGTFLEIVQGNHFKVAIGVPGLFMVGVDNAMVGGVFKDFMVKLPLLVTACMALRARE